MRPSLGRTQRSRQQGQLQSGTGALGLLTLSMFDWIVYAGIDSRSM